MGFDCPNDVMDGLGVGGWVGGNLGIGSYSMVGHEAAAGEETSSPGSEGGNEFGASGGAKED
jgi:hypothetical protein